MTKIKWVPATVLAMFLCAGLAKAQTPATGVEFFHGTMAEAMAKAKAESKILFIDSYTVWCGPCKMFSANTLTDANVAALYNAKFINLKVDIEKGEGPAFASKYGIIQIPTLLFLDSNGKLLSKKVGYIQPAEFTDWGRQMGEFKP